MTTDIQKSDAIPCPVCDGAGKVSHTYRYKPQHRNDRNSENIQRLSSCGLCGGTGTLAPTSLDEWQQLQVHPTCPTCKGQGGRYFWTWAESESGTRKVYSFEPCSLCAGKQHVLPEQLAQYERERRKLRFWGVGCTVVFVVVGLFVLTQVISLVMARTPWLQCCAPPHVVFVTGLFMVMHKWGWLSL